MIAVVCRDPVGQFAAFMDQIGNNAVDLRRGSGSDGGPASGRNTGVGCPQFSQPHPPFQQSGKIGQSSGFSLSDNIRIHTAVDPQKQHFRVIKFTEPGRFGNKSGGASAPLGGLDFALGQFLMIHDPSCIK